MIEHLRQYASPDSRHDGRIDDLLVSTHGKAVCHALVEQLSGQRLPNGTALCEFVLANVETITRMEPFWDTAFGRAQRCLETSDIVFADALALVAFRLAQFPCRGRCSAQLSKPIRLRWEDRLLPSIDAFAVDADGQGLELNGRLNNERVFSVKRSRGEVSVDCFGDHAEQRLQKSSGIALLSADAVLDDVILEDEFHSIFTYPAITSELSGQFESGLGILAALPEFDRWVRRVVRGIVVCETVRSRTRSSSWSEAPGLILVSSSDRPYLIAEMLVHEASHQYYNLVTRLGDAVDKSDTELHYSPAVARPRPLNKVLLGYHAFANFFLFYHEYRKVAADYREEVVRVTQELAAKLADFETVLSTSKSLTPIGEALFWPLYRRTEEARSCPV